MNCARAVYLLEESLELGLPLDTAAELQAHLAGCASCQTAREELKLLRQELARLPVPPVHEERLERMLATAVHAAAPPARRWRISVAQQFGLAAAAAVLICLGFLFGRQFGATRVPIREMVLFARPVVVGPAVTEVALVFRASDPIRRATISLTLPKDVEIAGRPDVRALTWHTELKSGDNLLKVPLRAIGAYGGNLEVRLSEGPLVRTLEVPIRARAEPNASAIRASRQATRGLG